MRECWFLVPGVGLFRAQPLPGLAHGEQTLLVPMTGQVYRVPELLVLWLPWVTNVTAGGSA